MPGKSQTDIAYGFTTIRRLDPRYYAYWLMNNILGQFGLGGRLADNIRERQGMAYYAFSAFDPSVGDGPLIIRAGVDPENVARARRRHRSRSRQLGSEGPTADELDESEQYLDRVDSADCSKPTPASPSSCRRPSSSGSGSTTIDGCPTTSRAVTLEQVRSAAAEVLHPERAAVAVAGPK